MVSRPPLSHRVRKNASDAVCFCQTHVHTVFNCRVVLLFVSLLLAIEIAFLGMYLFWSFLSSAASTTYSFDTSSDFTFDSSLIEVTSGVARLKALDQTDDDNSSSGFNGGTHSGTTYDSSLSAVTKSVADTSAGTFTSRAMDVATSTSWTSLAWVPSQPFWKELPSTSTIETAYAAGNADMTGNLLLNHFNEPAGATSFLDASAHFVTSSCSGSTCPTAGATGRFGNGLSFDGSNDYVGYGDVTATESLSAFTAETWINPTNATGKNLFQSYVEKWSTSSTMATSSFATFDMTTLNANAKGFQSGIFDGRYVYFVPRSTDTSNTASGLLARYDTQSSFSGSGSYSFFDMATVSPSSTGFKAAVFDGRYVYFVPNATDATLSTVNGQITRYDTQSSFSSASSYATFDTSQVNANSKGFLAGAFDGRYVYFIPNTLSSTVKSGQITRYDTQSSFTASASYTFFDMTTVDASARGFAGAIFDGRYLYLTPLSNGSPIARYDTQSSFSDSSSYGFFHASSINANAMGYVGGVFDGRYVYFIQDLAISGGGGLLTRYDTQSSFADSSAYTITDLTTINSTLTGFVGGIFDGRYVYLVPFANSSNGKTVRYDTLNSFSDTASYSYWDLSGGSGTIARSDGAVFDGRYIYFVPDLVAPVTFSGNIIRYDTTGGGNASYALRAMHGGDGLSSSLPGITVLLNTSVGIYTVSDWQSRSASAWHHVAMTYDGSALNLYVDGLLSKTTTASGSIADSSIALTLGAFNGGSSKTFNGSLDETALYSRALSATDVLNHYRRGANRLKFQVRSCSDGVCASGTFIGPDGTNATFYTELLNQTTSTPSLSLNSVTNNRALQYRATLETDNASYLPQIKSVTVGPTHYSPAWPSIQPTTGVAYSSIQEVTQTLGSNNQGTVRYQFSPDGSSWYYWSGSGWTSATTNTQSNVIGDLNPALTFFAPQVGPGRLFFRAFLVNTTGTQATELDALNINSLISTSGGGGGTVNPTLPPLVAQLQINNGAATTTTSTVQLVFSHDPQGPRIVYSSLSNTSTFEGAGLQPFQATRTWDVCPATPATTSTAIAPLCPAGIYPIFARLFTDYGVSALVSSQIYYHPPQKNEVPTSTPPDVGGGSPEEISSTSTAIAATTTTMNFSSVEEEQGLRSAKILFTGIWSMGSQGKEVKGLQKFLNDNGFVLAKTDSGSPGKETTYFGLRLSTALRGFQIFFRKEIFDSTRPSGLGIFGPRTRRFINRLRNASSR